MSKLAVPMPPLHNHSPSSRGALLLRASAFVLLALVGFACGEEREPPDPRCVALCEDAESECGEESREKCENDCMGYVLEVPAEYTDCVLEERAHLSISQTGDSKRCDFTVTGAAECWPEE